MPNAPRLAEAFPEAEALLARLREGGLTIAFAESCTGGLLGAALTAFAGSSDVVRGGIVSYADDLKMSLLDVPAEALRTHGAVSSEVARAMATGVRARCGANMGVSITGVAGPTGSTDEKPAGLIFIGVATREREEVVRIDGDAGREANRAGAVRAAIELCSRHAGSVRGAPG